MVSVARSISFSTSISVIMLGVLATVLSFIGYRMTSG